MSSSYKLNFRKICLFSLIILIGPGNRAPLDVEDTVNHLNQNLKNFYELGTEFYLCLKNCVLIIIIIQLHKYSDEKTKQNNLYLYIYTFYHITSQQISIIIIFSSLLTYF